MDWNPHAGRVVGAEFVPRADGLLPAYRIDNASAAAVMTLPTTVTEAVADEMFFVNADSGPGMTAGLVPMLIAEIFEEGNEVPGAVVTTVCRPNAVTVSGGYSATPSSTAAVLAIIQQTFPNPSTYVLPGAITSHIQFNVAFAVAGLFTGRRIVALRLCATMADPDNIGISTRIVENALGFWQALYTPGQQITGSGIGQFSFNTGEIKPITGTPWTVGDVEGLADFELTFGNFSGSGPSVVQTQLYQVWLEVDHVPETREAVMLVLPAAAGPQWTTTPMRKPDGTAGITKTAGTALTTVLRQVHMGGFGGYPPGYSAPLPDTYLRFSVPYIEGLMDVPVPGLQQYADVALNSDGTIASMGAPTLNRVIGVAYNAGASVDSQPYATVTAIPVDAEIDQGLSQTYTGLYDGIKVALRYTGTPDPITFELYRRSDSIIFGTGTIDQALADDTEPDSASGWRPVVALFVTPAALVGGTQYAIRLTPTTAGQWETSLLSSAEATYGTTAGGAGTYNGTSDSATYDAVNDPEGDFPILAYFRIHGPSNLEVTPNIVPLN